MRGATYREQNGTWSWRYSYTDPSGRRRQPRERGFATEREAQAALRERLRGHDGGIPVVEPAKDPIATYLRRWLRAHRAQVSPRTFERYAQLIEHDVIPVVGHLPITRVTPLHIEEVLGRARRRGLSPASVLKVRNVLSKSMGQAVKWRLIAANPVSATSRPKVSRADLTVPSASDLSALKRAAIGSPWEIPMLLAITLGTRRAETLAIAWEHVDLGTGRVRVLRSLQRIDGELRFTELKTPRARRTIVLPVSARARLDTHRASQAEALHRVGMRQGPRTLVCSGADGGPLCPDAFTHAAKRFARSVGLPDARLHDARHGYATQLLEHGVHPGIASAVLGHASPAFTMATYQHVVDGMAERAAEAIERALGGGT